MCKSVLLWCLIWSFLCQVGVGSCVWMCTKVIHVTALLPGCKISVFIAYTDVSGCVRSCVWMCYSCHCCHSCAACYSCYCATCYSCYCQVARFLCSLGVQMCQICVWTYIWMCMKHTIWLSLSVCRLCVFTRYTDVYAIMMFRSLVQQ